MKIEQAIEALGEDRVANIAAQYYTDLRAGKIRPSAATRRAKTAERMYPVGTQVEFTKLNRSHEPVVISGTVIEHAAGTVNIQSDDGTQYRVVPKDVRPSREGAL